MKTKRDKWPKWIRELVANAHTVDLSLPYLTAAPANTGESMRILAAYVDQCPPPAKITPKALAEYSRKWAERMNVAAGLTKEGHPSGENTGG